MAFGGVLALGVCACSDSRSAAVVGNDAASAPDSMAARDAEITDPVTAAGSTADPEPRAGAGGGRASTPTSGSGGAGVSVAPLDAAVVQDAGSDAGSNCDMDCPTPVGLKPELLAIWHFGWEGGNLSYFQIALCKDGVAAYLFAEGPNDPDAIRLYTEYVVHDPLRLTANFPKPAVPSRVLALDFELEYDLTLDRMHRLGEDYDGYESYGPRFMGLGWPEPAASCP